MNSIPGIGRLTAITIIAEIGDIDGFVKPKHLVAFFGIDSSVNESGKFKGNQNKIFKRYFILSKIQSDAPDDCKYKIGYVSIR